MKKIQKILSVIKRSLIKKKVYLNVDSYMKSYTAYLKGVGIDFTGEKKKVKFIEPSAYFDGTDYALIHIGDNVTVSREVMILTHDYSLTTAMSSLGVFINRNEGELYFKRDVRIGDNTFIGARVSLLPGTQIGNNCIIGACSVIKGKIPDGSIVVGNPSKIIGNTTEYAEKHIELKDYDIER